MADLPEGYATVEEFEADMAALDPRMREANERAERAMGVVQRGHKPSDVVSYFGGHQAAMHDDWIHVHIFRDGDQETFCGLTDGLRYGRVREVGRAYRGCEECFTLAQEERRDA